MVKIRGKRRVGKILLVVVGVILLIGCFVLVFLVRKGESALVGAIRANPSKSAVVAYTIDKQGNMIDDGQSISINPDTPLVTASIMKVIVLAAYESAVVNGELDANEMVPISDVERYYLPKTDGNAHANGLASLGIKTDDLGFALDRQASIKLDDIASIMIHYSGNAETDYLLQRIGIDEVNSVAKMENHTAITPILRTGLALTNHEFANLETNQLNDMISRMVNGDEQLIRSMENNYLNNSSWRAMQLDFLRSNEYIKISNQLGWDGLVRASYLLPRGTAREYAALMAKIASGKMISQEVSRLMQQKLESNPYDGLLRALFYQKIGDKDGLTTGVISLVTYCTPKNGVMKGQTRVVVIISNDIDQKSWMSAYTGQGIYFLQKDLAMARGLFTELMDLQE